MPRPLCKLYLLQGTGRPVDMEEEFRLLTLQVIGEAILGLQPAECDQVRHGPGAAGGASCCRALLSRLQSVSAQVGRGKTGRRKRPVCWMLHRFFRSYTCQ